MQPDHFSQMENAALEIEKLLQKLSLPQKLFSKIGDFISSCIWELQDQRKKMIELENRLASLEYSVELENSALRERVEEYESWAYWNGEDVISRADYRDMNEED